MVGTLDHRFSNLDASPVFFEARRARSMCSTRLWRQLFRIRFAKSGGSHIQTGPESGGGICCNTAILVHLLVHMSLVHFWGPDTSRKQEPLDLLGVGTYVSYVVCQRFLRPGWSRYVFAAGNLKLCCFLCRKPGAMLVTIQSFRPTPFGNGWQRIF